MRRYHLRTPCEKTCGGCPGVLIRRNPTEASPQPAGNMSQLFSEIMSALEHAITASFAAREPDRPALSPLRALGRRQMSGIEVLAQAIATTAPAASMVILPITMLTNETMLSGLLTVVAATVIVSMIAFCGSQFTRRFAASGGLYTFAFQGVGSRGALTVGAAMLCKYCASGAMTMYFGGHAVRTVLRETGLNAAGVLWTLLIYATIGLLMLACLLRGVRFAATAILVVELCSLLFIVSLMMFPAPQEVQIEPSGASNGLLLVALGAMFALAGFESATFFAPEAKRPLVTITRTVLLTPVICGALFTFAAWAVWSGRGGVLINAYLHGTSTGIDAWLVVALNVGLSCSWLASSMASSNAASRLVYTMGIERVLPRVFSQVHRSFRTPHVALTVVIAGLATASSIFAFIDGSVVFEDVKLLARASIVLGYTVVAVAAVRFLQRIGELTPAVIVSGVLGCAVGCATLTSLVVSVCREQNLTSLTVFTILAGSGLAWHRYLRHRTPKVLDSIGVFDSAESNDVLPGAASYGKNSRGAVALVKLSRHDAR